MQPIEAILFEPVGCLAEFPADEFNAIAERVLGHPPTSSKSGSEAYWYVLDLMGHRKHAAHGTPACGDSRP
jgi:hypothetical protein